MSKQPGDSRHLRAWQRSVFDGVLFLILLLAPLLVSAKTYTSPELGFSIRIDEVFSQPTEDGEMYVFTAAGGRDRIIIQNWPGLTVEAVREAGRAGYRDDGVDLRPRGAAREHQPAQGWGLSLPVSGVIDRQKVEGMLGGFVGEQGQGFIILIASSPENWPRLRAKARPLFDSIAFVEYRGGVEVEKWQQYLQGKRLAYRSTYDGGSSREDYYLCSDGRFLQSGGTYDFATAPGVSVFGQSGKRGAGNWRVQAVEGEAYLVFTYDDGREESARLEDKGGKTLLNGSRYYVVENDQCD